MIQRPTRKGAGPPQPKVKISYSSELEHRLASQAAHYRWEEFSELPGDVGWAGDGDCKAMVIATWRCQQDLEAAWH